MESEIQTEKLLRTFGQVIRSLRNKMNLSQEELADRAGLHRTYIGDIERGARNIALKNIFRISDALEVEPEKLVRTLSNQIRKAK